MTDKEKTYGRMTLYLTLGALCISVGGLLWTSSSVNTKAMQAYAFVSENHALPMTVEYHEERLSVVEGKCNELNEILVSITKLNGNIHLLSSQIKDLKKRLGRLHDSVASKSDGPKN